MVSKRYCCGEVSAVGAYPFRPSVSIAFFSDFQSKSNEKLTLAIVPVPVRLSRLKI